MPSITGFSHLSFTVTDRDRSIAWYEKVLGFTRHSEVNAATFRRTRMWHDDGHIMVTLTQHDAGSGDRFDETRTGIDHLSFAVPDLDDLKAWKRRFEQYDVDHSGIKQTSSKSWIITFRDPDNIQLEVFALKPEGRQ